MQRYVDIERTATAQHRVPPALEGRLAFFPRSAAATCVMSRDGGASD
jgi:hypothetical protein